MKTPIQQQIQQHLTDLQIAMTLHKQWEASPPPAEALASTEPFCIGHLTPTQWLQWIFIPRMRALLDANADLPCNFAITPYLEEALKEEAYLTALCEPLLKLEKLQKM